MKQTNLVFTLLIAIGIGFPTMLGIGLHMGEQKVEATIKAWRQAARPVFKARNIPGLAAQATPRELEAALNSQSVLTRAETYKWSPLWEGKDRPTQLIIASADQEWVRKH